MAVSCVYLSADVFLVCLNHALVTENEEIMGLLIGEIDESRISRVSAVIMLRRSDKRKDRVEISPEQLSDASTQAEKLAHQLKRPMRVIGWYHSHPHITVWPSHVDVRTQAMYQMMDEGFIGLIVSVYSEDRASNQGRIQLTCFQSARQEGQNNQPIDRIDIPVHIVPTTSISPTCLETMTRLPVILCQEEEDAYNASCVNNSSLLRQLYNEAVFTKAVCHIAEVTSVPLQEMLQNRLQQNKEQLLKLQVEKNTLLKQLKL